VQHVCPVGTLCDGHSGMCLGGSPSEGVMHEMLDNRAEGDKMGHLKSVCSSDHWHLGVCVCVCVGGGGGAKTI